MNQDNQLRGLRGESESERESESESESVSESESESVESEIVRVRVRGREGGRKERRCPRKTRTPHLGCGETQSTQSGRKT